MICISRYNTLNPGIFAPTGPQDENKSVKINFLLEIPMDFDEKSICDDSVAPAIRQEQRGSQRTPTRHMNGFSVF